MLHHRPAHILELGPGTSTAVLALAFRRVQAIDATYHPIFVSIEDQPEWLDYHEKSFPAELRSLVELIHRPSTVRRVADRMVACYEEIPDHPYSLIHIDGPGLLAHGIDVSGDLVALAPTMPSHSLAIFDGRQETARFSAAALPDWHWRWHPFTLNRHLMRR